MEHYSQRVRESILPLSVGDSLPTAFEEWSFSGETYDHEHPKATCELCEQEQLRYHFQISNSLTESSLWVGSRCILKFGLSVFESGERLSAADAKKKLNRLSQQMRQDSCIKALERAAEAEDNSILARALADFRVKKALTPKQAFVVLWRLKKNSIDHSPNFFKVELKRKQHKDDLEAMETSRVHMIWPALSTSQRTLAERMGHEPPTS